MKKWQYAITRGEGILLDHGDMFFDKNKSPVGCVSAITGEFRQDIDDGVIDKEDDSVTVIMGPEEGSQQSDKQEEAYVHSR